MQSDGEFTAVRPFTKLVNLANGASGAVELRDSAGSGLLCNYIEVIPCGPINVLGDFQAFLSGAGESTSPVSGVVAGNARGSLGKSIGFNSEIVFDLDYEDETSGIILVNNLGAAYDIAINYGVKKPQKPVFMITKSPNLGNK